ncbi:MAG: hypothetical protein LC751_12595 [Actinobacteria bacterium]|nr:hypothetical protein [Actinomycetota bacterium]
MKKLMLMAAVLAMVVVAAVPALAQHRHHNNNDNNNNDKGGGVSQTNEQDVQSGDSSQTFTVTGGGDNSNSCQGIQGVSNTGNAVNNTGVLQYASDGDVEVSDSGNFTISPSSSTTCKQEVNQAASASGN